MDDYADIFLNWIRTPAVGCHFAQALALDPGAAKWDGATIFGNRFDSETINVLNAYFDEAFGKLEAVHALFPEVTAPTDVVSLIQALCTNPRWKCVEINVDCPHASRSLLVGLRWFLPDGKLMNYVLGFGNFSPMPNTRRAPFTALVLRPGPPGNIPSIAHAHKVGRPDDRTPDMCPIPVHLADMALPEADDKKIARMWEKTGTLKEKKLSGDEMAKAAKAKVTFCLPPELREELADLLLEKVTAPLVSESM